MVLSFSRAGVGIYRALYQIRTSSKAEEAYSAITARLKPCPSEITEPDFEKSARSNIEASSGRRPPQHDNLSKFLQRLRDPFQAGFFPQHFHGFEQRRSIFPAADGDADRLEHLTGLQSQLLRGGTQGLVERIVLELDSRQHFARFFQRPFG